MAVKSHEAYGVERHQSDAQLELKRKQKIDDDKQRNVITHALLSSCTHTCSAAPAFDILANIIINVIKLHL